MLILLGFICVILGFIINILGMKQIKNDNNLKYGIINKSYKKNKGYILEISYGSLQNQDIEETSIWVKKKPISKELILTTENDEIEIYKGKKKILFLSLICWFIGGLLCIVF